MKRNFLNSTGRVALVAAFLLGLFMPAGASAQENGQAPVESPEHRRHQPMWLSIMAFTDAPVVGADVRVTVGPHGPLLVDAKAATNRQGVFPARVWRPWLLREQAEDANQPERRRRSFLRISISGGTTNGDPFLEHLTADIELTDPDHQILVVNPVTTLVSRLLDERSELKDERLELKLGGAKALVRRFLKLPANYTLGLALRQSSHYVSPFFSTGAFMAEAGDAGGLDAFEHLLLQELASPSATHSFRPPNLLGSTGSDATSAMQAGLYAGLLDVAGAEGVGGLAGWALSLTGLFPTSDTTQNDIDALTSALNDLQSSIDNLSSQVQALTNLVQSTATQEEYNTIVVPAQSLASTVNGVESDLAYWASACPPYYVGQTTTNPQPYCTSRKVSIDQELNETTIQQAYGSLEVDVKDNPATGFRGMLHLYSLWLGQSKRFFRAADSTKMQNLYDFWDAALTQAANLKIEVLHEGGTQGVNPPNQLTDFMGNPDASPPTTGLFQGNQAANLQLTFPPVAAGTVINTSDHLMWALVPWVAAHESYGIPDQYVPAAQCWSWRTPFFQGASYYPLLPYAGFNDWAQSPNKSQWQDAVQNAVLNPTTTPNWRAWLIQQTQTTDGEMPASPGFFNWTTCSDMAHSYAWTSTPNGQAAGAQAYWYIDPVNDTFGSLSPPQLNNYNQANGTGGLAAFPIRGLAAGEQYFWYQ